jgi:hypothetical protein
VYELAFAWAFGASSLQRLGSVGVPQPPLMYNNSEVLKALMFLIEFFICDSFNKLKIVFIVK